MDKIQQNGYRGKQGRSQKTGLLVNAEQVKYVLEGQKQSVKLSSEAERTQRASLNVLNSIRKWNCRKRREREFYGKIQDRTRLQPGHELIGIRFT